jgi:hypothetical protein
MDIVVCISLSTILLGFYLHADSNRSQMQESPKMNLVQVSNQDSSVDELKKHYSVLVEL